MQKKNKGFTLIEMLVVVLIIGILAGIALPQYQMAVTKAKVASILPLMRRWKDALAEYKLQHGDYVDENGDSPDGATLGVNWPSDWNNGNCGDNTECENDYWYCIISEAGEGSVFCNHNFTDEGDDWLYIIMSQPDNEDEYYEELNGLTICLGKGKGDKVCKSIGRKLLEDISLWDGTAYQLN